VRITVSHLPMQGVAGHQTTLPCQNENKRVGPRIVQAKDKAVAPF